MPMKAPTYRSEWSADCVASHPFHRVSDVTYFFISEHEEIRMSDRIDKIL